MKRFDDDDKEWVHRSDKCFACGTDNEAGLGMALYRVGERVYADYSVPKRFRGLSKTTHGGIITTLLDEVVVSGVSHLAHEMCVTTEMTVRFNKPVVLEQPVQIRAWVVSRDGDRLQGAGEVVDEQGRVLAECECSLLALDPERAKRFLRDETAAALGKARDEPAQS